MSLQNEDFLSDDASPSKSPPELFSFSLCKKSVIMISTTSLVLLLLFLLAVAVAVAVRCKRKNKRLTSILDEEKDELEKQKSQLSGVLKTVKKEREENKRRLQTVETEISERQERFEKPDELLREKEHLLNTEWKFDQEKEMCEREILNREKLLEPIENRRPHKSKE